MADLVEYYVICEWPLKRLLWLTHKHVNESRRPKKRVDTFQNPKYLVWILDFRQKGHFFQKGHFVLKMLKRIK